MSLLVRALIPRTRAPQDPTVPRRPHRLTPPAWTLSFKAGVREGHTHSAPPGGGKDCTREASLRLPGGGHTEGPQVMPPAGRRSVPGDEGPWPEPSAGNRSDRGREVRRGRWPGRTWRPAGPRGQVCRGRTGGPMPERTQVIFPPSPAPPRRPEPPPGVCPHGGALAPPAGRRREDLPTPSPQARAAQTPSLLDPSAAASAGTEWAPRVAAGRAVQGAGTLIFLPKSTANHAQVPSGDGGAATGNGK